MTLIIGAGEIGKALYEVLGKVYEVRMIDIGDEGVGPFDIIHICFPYSDKFEEAVTGYRQKYLPKYTVIHSTVPPGTSKKLGATHSPIIGQHPYLAESLKTFTKFVGGIDADEVSEYFRKAGLKTYICRKSETTEIGKVLLTNYYAVCIEFIKEAEKICDKFKIPFAEAFTIFNQEYNKGYSKLGYPEYQRPVLQPQQSKIGGHCIIPNLDFLNSKFSKFISKLNK